MLYTELLKYDQPGFIQADIYDDLVLAGLESPPDAEICCVLLGKPYKKTYQIDAHIAVRNVAADPLQDYILDPRKMGEIYNTTYPFNPKVGKDRRFVGVFHTHPQNHAYPSQKDIEGAQGGNIYLIFSPKYKELNAFWVPQGEGKVPQKPLWRKMDLHLIGKSKYTENFKLKKTKQHD